MDLMKTLDEIYAQVKVTLSGVADATVIWNDFVAFFGSVDWTEPWILGLLGFEASLLLLTIWFRSRWKFQGFGFFMIAILIYKAEYLNSLCAQNWRQFATQDYFDQNGLFWSLIVSGPLLFILFVILVNYMLEMVKLMIQMKKKQLILESRQRKEAKKEK